MHAPEIKNDLEFTQWQGRVGDELREASYDKYQCVPSPHHVWIAANIKALRRCRSCLNELQLSKSHLDSLLHDTSNTLELLSTLSNSFQTVEEHTSVFMQQCEGLLSAQKKSSVLADDIQDNLQYYDFLDPVSRRLNAPGAGNSVRTKEFSDMLRNIDECLDYMHAHVSEPCLFPSIYLGVSRPLYCRTPLMVLF